MIQSLPPPPPPIQCVAPAPNLKGNTYVTLSGDPTQVDAILTQMKAAWVLDAKAENNGVEFARLRGGLNIPYRDIGGLIIEAQRRGVALALSKNPPICMPGDDE